MALIRGIPTQVWHYFKHFLNMLNHAFRWLNSFPKLRMFSIFVTQFLACSGLFSHLKTFDFEALRGLDYFFSASTILVCSSIWGIVVVVFDGYFLGGYFRQNLTLTLENSTLIEVSITEGDLFAIDGYRVIPVNDFFDAIVDNKVISKRSLHGMALAKFWPSADSHHKDWSEEVKAELRKIDYLEKVSRTVGNHTRYPIGTSVSLEKDNSKFIFVALSKTNKPDNVTTATLTDYVSAISQCLQKARAVCNGGPLVLPLIGSGLSRLGLKPETLLQILLLSIAKESNTKFVTRQFKIVLTSDTMKRVNLYRLHEFWRQIKS